MPAREYTIVFSEAARAFFASPRVDNRVKRIIYHIVESRLIVDIVQIGLRRDLYE